MTKLSTVVLTLGSVLALPACDLRQPVLLRHQQAKPSPAATKKPAPKPIPSPTTKILALRDLLFGDTKLADLLKKLGPTLANALQPLVHAKSFADARDMLEKATHRVAQAENPYYWAVLAEIRSEAGDTVGAVDAAAEYLRRARKSIPQVNAYRLLRILGEAPVPNSIEATSTIGVIVEIGRPSGLHLIAAFADGTAWVADGDGKISESVNAKSGDDADIAARAVVGRGTPLASSTPVKLDRSLPMQDQVVITLLTPAGPRVIRSTETDLRSSSSAANGIWLAVHDLEAQIAAVATATPPK